MENNEITPVVIFKGSMIEAEIVKSLLENAEIEAFIEHGFSGTLAPWVNASGGAGPVRVVVANIHESIAKTIVNEFEQNRNITE